MSETVEVDPELLATAATGAAQIADKMDKLLRDEGKQLDACADVSSTWETASALRRCADAGRGRIRSQADDVAGFGDKLKRVGGGYRDAERWAADSLRAIAKRLEGL